jgi:hypothetical protein
MIKFSALLPLVFMLSTIAQGQTASGSASPARAACNCLSNFEWVRKTFEENDAGFQYVIDKKGRSAYDAYNKQFLEKIRAVQDPGKCLPLLYEWMTFFRSGHIAIRPLNNQSGNNGAVSTAAVQQFPGWETLSVDLPAFEKYLQGKKDPDYEGVWESPPYKIGIKKDSGVYKGFIIESGTPAWTKGQVKLRITPVPGGVKSVFYMRDHSPQESGIVEFIGKNHLQVGNFSLQRVAPVYEDEPTVAEFLKAAAAQKPFVDVLNKTTLLLRIPSFSPGAKQDIDSVLAANRDRILATENLIIDISNGTGGSDESYEKIIPFLYTNPIRVVGVEYLSTPLNNQRMLDFINKPSYGFNEEQKKWAKNSYDKLSRQVGQFVNLDSGTVSIDRMDTVYPYPKNVGIIINEGNGSTDEQFLLAAKQSRKVKLFGATTMGALDISNMYFIPSPCGEFELGYCLSRSMRIPGMTIDGKGIQPDYYLDRSIPRHQWLSFVSDVLNGK